MMDYRNRSDAQKRVDRIQAFRAELAELSSDGVLDIGEGTQASIQNHHNTVLADLADRFDVDVTVSARQLSTGMLVASTIAAAALCAAVFFLFYRFWHHFTATAQTVILIAAPLGAAVLVDVAARREKTRYFATLLGLVALALFVLNLSALAGIFNVTPSQYGMLAWAIFALILAYTWQLRLLLYAGLGFGLFFLAAMIADISGIAWTAFGNRLESFTVAGLVILALAWFTPRAKSPRFPHAYYVVGLAALLLSLYFMGQFAMNTMLPLSEDAAKTLYQILSFLVSGAGIAYGLWARTRIFTNFGVAFFVLNLYTKFFHWWWDWIPAYLFFLVVGLISVGLLFLLRAIRERQLLPRTGGGGER